MQFIQRWDQKPVNSSYHTVITNIRHVLAMDFRTGDGPLYLLIAVILTWNDGVRGQFLPLCLKAFAIELPIYWLIKNSFKRERPRNLPVFITPSDRYNLPSGHTAAAF